MGTDPHLSDDEFFDDEAFHLDGLSDEEKILLATLLRSEIDPDEIGLPPISGDRDTGDVEVPIPADFAARLSDRVMKSIQAGDLGAELLRFGTIGLVRACLSLLGPAFSLNDDDDKEEESQ